MAKQKNPRHDFTDFSKEGWEDFSLKSEWFNRYRDPGAGRTLREVYEAAIAQSHRMDRYVHEVPPFPDKPLKKPTLGLVEGRNVTISGTRNPNPKGAIGYVSSAVKVASKGDMTHSVLFIPLDPNLKKSVEENTICIFRYVAATDAWRKLPVCGISTDGTTAWAYIHEPGVYIAIALPADPVLQASLLMLYMYKGELPASMKKTDRIKRAKELLKGHGKLAALLSGISEDEFESPGKHTTKSARGGFFGFPGDLPMPGDFPGGGFAEWDILDDICPPWLGPKHLYIPGRWPRPPLRWPDILYPWPPFPWDWRAVGPKNINGRIASLCIHPSDSNILYAGAANGGVWKTVNAGATWTHQWVTEDTMAIGSIALCRNFPNTLYAATGEDTPGWGPSYPGVGIFKTTDGGGTWNPCPGGGTGDRCMKILVHPTDPNSVYVGSNTGFFRTSDGGTTPWTLIRNGHVTDAVMDPSNPNIIYVAIWNDGIYKTTDGGTIWNAVNGSWQWRWSPKGLVKVWRGIPTGSAAEWIALAIGNNGTGGTNFLIAKLGLDSGHIYKTSNGGGTWFKVAGPVQPVSYNEWTNMCAINPDNHNILFAGGVGLSRATNGSTFNPTSGTHSDHQQLVFDPFNSNICYVATDGGVYKSTNGGQNWTLQSTNLQATQLLSFGVSQTGNFIIGGATQDQGIIQTSGSTNWINNGGGNEWGIFVVDHNNSQNIYISPGNGTLRQSVNGGGSWTSLTNGLTDTVNGTTTTHAKTVDLAVKSGNSNVLLFAGRINDDAFMPTYSVRKIWRSTNKGVSFSTVFTMAASDVATQVLFAPSNGNIAFFTCSNGKVFKSSSSGSNGSWAEPYAPADKPVTANITCIAIGWNDPNLVLLGYGGFGATRIMRSTDGGAHWTNISGSIAETALPLIPLNAIAFDQNDPNRIFVGTDIGVFRTTDGGVNWANYNSGFLSFDHPKIIVTGMHVRKENNALYTGTLGRGAYRKYL